ncbi:MAG: tRNA (N6-isopentenyl adenosine(37)-C2)-methylthiotransferase MiaB [Ruminococcus sp.]|nr:tRNA (N6-isopentenyl adenosine(37)-C2)-methylthiotransferase MiaB [Ruminococcus sp.]MCD7800889.1 tRNA (N6-isopentenyl adenosine(37)-C2)-methylthiotransferase MiaB [Ruminococcus sp.]
MQEYIQKVKDIITSKDKQSMAYVQTFGCQLNFSEGEKIKGLLAQMGYGLTDIPDNADIIIFNTCAVRENAEDRVFGQIGAIKRFKRTNPNLIVGISGCMAQEKHICDKVKKSYPYVDIVFGTSAMDKFPKLLLNVLNGQKHAFDITEYGDIIDESFNQVRDSKIFASVPIMYGCNNFCTYCIVPYVRGRERSRKSKTIINEVTQLVYNGYKEIMLLGQNVNSYGNDLEDEISFPELLRSINAIEGDFIIRFMSSHPKDATPELIDTIFECDKVGKHLHLPVQCGSNSILQAMNRRYTIEKYLEIIDYARSKCEDFSFTTDIIIGFPNETDADFQSTVDLIKRVKYDNIYSFIYSKRSGTKASLIDDKVSDETKGRRMREFLAVQRDITDKSYKRFIGRTMRVLVSGESKTKGVLTGKSSEYIIVEFIGDSSLIGKFVNVKITQSRNWSVFGELI